MTTERAAPHCRFRQKAVIPRVVKCCGCSSTDSSIRSALEVPEIAAFDCDSPVLEVFVSGRDSTTTRWASLRWRALPIDRDERVDERLA